MRLKSAAGLLFAVAPPPLLDFLHLAVVVVGGAIALRLAVVVVGGAIQVVVPAVLRLLMIGMMRMS
jgi:hypothetical protein